MSSGEFILIDFSLELSSADDSSSEPEIDQSSTKFCQFSNKPPYPNCEKVIILPVCSWNDVGYIIYETAVCIASDSEYGCDQYDNAL